MLRSVSDAHTAYRVTVFVHLFYFFFFVLLSRFLCCFDKNSIYASGSLECFIHVSLFLSFVFLSCFCGDVLRQMT